MLTKLSIFTGMQQGRWT